MEPRSLGPGSDPVPAAGTAPEGLRDPPVHKSFGGMQRRCGVLLAALALHVLRPHPGQPVQHERGAGCVQVVAYASVIEVLDGLPVQGAHDLVAVLDAIVLEACEGCLGLRGRVESEAGLQLTKC